MRSDCGPADPAQKNIDAAISTHAIISLYARLYRFTSHQPGFMSNESSADRITEKIAHTALPCFHASFDFYRPFR